jgi:hypothetical protein
MSATVSTFPHSHTLPSEPFGQAGVRQYIGRILAWIFFTMALAAAAMAQRSGAFQEGNGYYDEVQWRAKGHGLGVVSIYGQVALFGGTTVNPSSDSGWRFRGGYVRDYSMRAGRRWGMANSSMVPWETDTGRMLGAEWQSRAPGREFSEGFLLRFKWMTLAVLFMLQPLVYVLMQLRRRRAEARDEA